MPTVRKRLRCVTILDLCNHQPLIHNLPATVDGSHVDLAAAGNDHCRSADHVQNIEKVIFDPFTFVLVLMLVELGQLPQLCQLSETHLRQ